MAIACQVIQGAVDQARGNLPFTGRVCRHAWLDNMLLNDSVDRSNVGAMSDLANYMPVAPGLKVGPEIGVPRHRRARTSTRLNSSPLCANRLPSLAITNIKKRS